MLAVEESTTADLDVSTATLTIPTELPAAIVAGGPGINANCDGNNIPVPLSATICGLSGALSEICSVAERGPRSDGVNAIVNVQTLNTISGSGQLLLWMKSAAFGPAMLALNPVNGAVPVLVTFTNCGGETTPRFSLPNARATVEILASGAATPTPLRFAN